MTQLEKLKEERRIDFLFSKSFLDSFLESNMITQSEYKKCIRDLELIYLEEEEDR